MALFPACWLSGRHACGDDSLAQERNERAAALTAADYARAEKFMTYNTAPLVLHAGACVRPG